MADKTTVDVLEEVVDTVEQTLDILEEGVEVANKTTFAFLRNPKVLAAVLVLGTAGSSAYFGYKFAQKKLDKYYAELAEEEIASVKTRYSAITKKDEFAEPQALAAKYERAEQNGKRIDEVIIREQSYRSDETVVVVGDEEEESSGPTPAAVVVRNVFDERQSHNADDDWDYEEQKLLRAANPGEPYIIHQEEYFGNENEYDQIQVTYFEGDDVVADERSERMVNWEQILGETNLQKFGFGSKDNNVVYIRNDRLEAEYEVIHSDGHYSEEVLGFLEHSDSRRKQRPRSFRNYDD